MFQFFGGLGGGAFEGNYRAYPVSFIDKLDAENGNKIFLPPSALDRLASLHIEYPMLFKVENRKNSRVTHCGVLEFIAEEGMVYMPYWMMQNLLLEEGEIVNMKSASLSKGTYVKLQPHTKDFLDITNPKVLLFFVTLSQLLKNAVLEMTLRSYACLTEGDCICMYYNNKRYYIDIVETRPKACDSEAISVIETDCEVDFAPPLDYVEPAAAAPVEEPMEDDGAPGPSGEQTAPEEPRFTAFVGTGRRLDGKTPSQPAPLQPAGDPSSSGQPSTSGTPAANSAAKKKAVAGKVVFGGGNRLLEKKAADQAAAAGAAPPPKKRPEGEKPKEEEPTFKAFSGKSRSLKG